VAKKELNYVVTERQHKYLWRMGQIQNKLQVMWQDERVQFYDDKEMPGDKDVSSVYLAGPTSRNQILEYNWRCEAVKILREVGFTGWIYCPEPRGEEISGSIAGTSKAYKWESDRLLTATHVAFWIPRKGEELLGLNTNFELAFLLGGLTIKNNLNERNLFVGWPIGAERMALPRHYLNMSGMTHYSELQKLCEAVSSAPRKGPKDK